jgi:Zn-dependent peptidase ImmA (M78 family)
VEDYTKTLLHELQHVLQHVRGDLKDKGQKRLWKGIDCSDLDYDEMPWEQEAHKLEEILYHEYLTNCQ